MYILSLGKVPKNPEGGAKNERKCHLRSFFSLLDYTCLVFPSPKGGSNEILNNLRPYELEVGQVPIWIGYWQFIFGVMTSIYGLLCEAGWSGFTKLVIQNCQALLTVGKMRDPNECLLEVRWSSISKPVIQIICFVKRLIWMIPRRRKPKSKRKSHAPPRHPDMMKWWSDSLQCSCPLSKWRGQFHGLLEGVSVCVA